MQNFKNKKREREEGREGGEERKDRRNCTLKKKAAEGRMGTAGVRDEGS